MFSPEGRPVSRGRGRRFIGAVLATIAAFVSLVCWSISSPAGSSPDELFHLSSIWCGHGIDEDTCQAGPTEDLRIVPHHVATGACFTQNNTVSGACRPDDTDDPMVPDAQMGLGNWVNHGYPRVYYFVMSFFVMGSFDTSTMLIRVGNSFFAVLIVAALTLLLPRRLKMVAPVAYLATSVPLMMFTVASTNPSSWAISSAGVTWLAVYGAFEARGRRQAALLALGLLGAMMAAGARTDAALFTVLGIVLAVGMRLGSLRAQWRVTAAAVVIAALSMALYFTSANTSVAANGLEGYGHVELTGFALFMNNFLQVPFLWMSAVGAGPMSSLGWFDTPMPWIVGFGGALVSAALCFVGWGSMWWKKAVALVLLGLALLVYPLLILQLTGIYAGDGVQPRYLLPMMVTFVGISLLPVLGRRITLTRVQAVALAVPLSIAHSVALYYNLWRYVRAITTPMQWIGDYTWWWSAPLPPPVAVWVVGSCAFAGMTVWLLWQMVPPRDAAPPRDREEAVEAARSDHAVPLVDAVPATASTSPSTRQQGS
jgi:hypothetical protein